MQDFREFAKTSNFVSKVSIFNEFDYIRTIENGSYKHYFAYRTEKKVVPITEPLVEDLKKGIPFLPVHRLNNNQAYNSWDIYILKRLSQSNGINNDSLKVLIDNSGLYDNPFLQIVTFN